MRGSITYPVDQIIGGLMPNKVYMTDESSEFVIEPDGVTVYVSKQG